ncbi:Ribonucleotide-diphosphate reductase (RNR), small subunit, partial [Ascosphaera pollenicola]
MPDDRPQEWERRYIPGLPSSMAPHEAYTLDSMFRWRREMTYHFYIAPRDELVVDTERGAKWQVGDSATEARVCDAAKSESGEEVEIALCRGLAFAYQVEGPEAGTRAFVKTYKQIVNDDYTPNTNVHISERVDNEMYALRDLSESGVTPRFLGCARETQGPEDVRPGGYMWYIFTDVLRGISPRDIASVEELDDCRIAVAKAAHTLSSHGWRLSLNYDPDQMRWDKASKR